jgi:hypothetical protein
MALPYLHGADAAVAAGKALRGGADLVGAAGAARTQFRGYGPVRRAEGLVGAQMAKSRPTNLVRRMYRIPTSGTGVPTAAQRAYGNVERGISRAYVNSGAQRQIDAYGNRNMARYQARLAQQRAQRAFLKANGPITVTSALQPPLLRG